MMLAALVARVKTLLLRLPHGTRNQTLVIICRFKRLFPGQHLYRQKPLSMAIGVEFAAVHSCGFKHHTQLGFGIPVIAERRWSVHGSLLAIVISSLKTTPSDRKSTRLNSS